MATSTYKKTYPALFISICKQGGGISDFCIQVDIVRATFYNWVHQFPDFEEAFNKGKEYTENWLTNLGIRGMKGEYEKFNATVWSILMRNKCSYVEHRKIAIDFTGCATADEKMAVLNERVAQGRLTPKEAKDYADYIKTSAEIHEKTEVIPRLEALEAKADALKT